MFEQKTEGCIIVSSHDRCVAVYLCLIHNNLVLADVEDDCVPIYMTTSTLVELINLTYLYPWAASPQKSWERLW